MDLFFLLLFLIGGLVLIILEIIAIPGTTVAGISGLAMIVYGVLEFMQNMEQHGEQFLCLLP